VQHFISYAAHQDPVYAFASVGGHYHQVMLFGCLQDGRNWMLLDNHSAGANPLGFCFCRYSAQDLPGLGLILVHLLL